jgi:hypothetical protein
MQRIAIARRSTRVERLLRENAGDHAGVLVAPLTALVGQKSYVREPARAAEELARDRTVPWPLRRIAVLMLETLLSRIDAADRDERRYWLERLDLPGSDELAREGYRPGEPLETQLWRRLARMGRIHRLALIAGTSDRALRDFLRAAEHECRLTLARHLFSHSEVIARIEHDLRRSTGIRDPSHHGHFLDEAARAIEGLPALERRIVEHLGRKAVIRWASSSTPETINSMIELPVGTVVLTVKPPGSTHEFEIKRAGLIRDLPLAVVWARNNYIVPSSHHLDGGAMHQLLMYEAENSSFFSYVFRTIHGVNASMSRTLYMATIHSIATPRGEVNLVDYFTDPEVFGEKYQVMRWNMYEVVKTLTGYDKEPWEEPINDLALTGNFIGRVKPAQAIQLGTTSFRLERLEKYLAPSGADRYFKQGLGVEFNGDDARRFADELLDEVLGQYEPPHVAWRSHAQYVEAAFRVPANRAAAAAAYLSVLEQLGRFWGTLLGIRGHTQGESFVERNAGLRSVWRDGRWQVELVFMDHDSLSFASIGTAIYRPRDSVANAAKDGKHVLGGVYGRSFRVRGELWFLRRIYRVGSVLERRGVAAFRAAMKRAYDRTHEAILTNPELTKLFHESFIKNLRDWDDLVKTYLKTPKTRSARNAWRTASHTRLAARGYDPDMAEEHVKTVTIQAKFLRRISFLF